MQPPSNKELTLESILIVLIYSVEFFSHRCPSFSSHGTGFAAVAMVLRVEPASCEASID